MVCGSTFVQQRYFHDQAVSLQIYGKPFASHTILKFLVYGVRVPCQIELVTILSLIQIKPTEAAVIQLQADAIIKGQSYSFTGLQPLAQDFLISIRQVEHVKTSRTLAKISCFYRETFPRCF